MSTLPLEYATEARDTYIRSARARTVVLHQLNDVRRDPAALASSGVTTEEVQSAFETVWKVSAFYESKLWLEANEERKANDRIVEPLRRAVSGDASPVAPLPDEEDD
ncbi:hypothetical protein [Auritidibacter ignavus]|uniref:hypothetical protein n=1 Tax=Auritidibacter ignavus TaxID=678932 RepID=UPI000F01D296|nr:hypothetical protein [Auritidibacter ignavus]NIH72250.1 hypothetical protein [Auritidibacter ignavus]RMX23740.1 hypothetical protein DYI20_02675 [Auritidibacter ignavus]